jgi:Flp pilus assembly protein TadB
MADLESLWHSAADRQSPRDPHRGPSALVKSVILAIIGLGVQFVLFMVKRGKARRLEEIKKREEEQERERIRLMEEEWKRQEEEEAKRQPEFVLSNQANNQ